MVNDSSASTRAEKPHLSDALKRRAQSVMNDKSIDARDRAIIHYGLETNDPLLADLVRRVDAGEIINDNLSVHSSDEKVAALAEMICRAGDESGIKSAALMVLMATLETPRIRKHSRTPRNTWRSLAAAN